MNTIKKENQEEEAKRYRQRSGFGILGSGRTGATLLTLDCICIRSRKAYDGLLGWEGKEPLLK